LPKKFRGRFTTEDDDNKKEDMVYGKQKINYDIDGIELLAKHEGYENAESLTMSRVLTDEDFKKIKILKMKNALKHVTKDDPFKKPEEEGEDESGEDEDDDSEIEFVSNEEDGEIEIDEEGEIELDEEGEIELDEDDEEELEEDDEDGEDEESKD
jgi:hypothetical protein